MVVVASWSVTSPNVLFFDYRTRNSFVEDFSILDKFRDSDLSPLLLTFKCIAGFVTRQMGQKLVETVLVYRQEDVTGLAHVVDYAREHDLGRVTGISAYTACSLYFAFYHDVLKLPPHVKEVFIVLFIAFRWDLRTGKIRWTAFPTEEHAAYAVVQCKSSYDVVLLPVRQALLVSHLHTYSEIKLYDAEEEDLLMLGAMVRARVLAKDYEIEPRRVQRWLMDPYQFKYELCNEDSCLELKRFGSLTPLPVHYVSDPYISSTPASLCLTVGRMPPLRFGLVPMRKWFKVHIDISVATEVSVTFSLLTPKEVEEQKLQFLEFFIEWQQNVLRFRQFRFAKGSEFELVSAPILLPVRSFISFASYDGVRHRLMTLPRRRYFRFSINIDAEAKAKTRAETLSNTEMRQLNLKNYKWYKNVYLMVMEILHMLMLFFFASAKKWKKVRKWCRRKHLSPYCP